HRRLALGLASVAVVVCACAGARAGPARPLQSLRLVVSVAWLTAQEQVKNEARPLAPRVPQPFVTTASRAPRSVGFRQSPGERWLLERPPPALLSPLQSPLISIGVASATPRVSRWRLVMREWWRSLFTAR